MQLRSLTTKINFQNCHFLVGLISVVLFKGLDPAGVIVGVRNYKNLNQYS